MNKPGYTTTEFWLSLLATLVGAVMASGAIPAEGVWTQVVGFVSMTLASLGYTGGRAFNKSSEMKANAIKEAAKSQGNG